MFEFTSSFDIVKRVNVGIEVSDFTSSPEFILNNDVNGTFDGKKRWAVSGIGQWMDFKFDSDVTLYGINIAWYRGNERKQSFKIYANNRLVFNGLSTGNNSSYEVYAFDEPILTDNVRITCYGNNIDQLNEISAVAFRPEAMTDTTVPEIAECPPGRHWNEVLQKCVSDSIDEPPLAVINQALETVKQGDKVILDGSNSSDPNGVPISFEWVQTRGELVTVSSFIEPTIMFRAPTVDTEIGFRLKVTNTGNLWATKDAKVIVRSDPQGEIMKEIIEKHQQVPAIKVIESNHPPKVPYTVEKLPRKKNRR